MVFQILEYSNIPLEIAQKLNIGFGYLSSETIWLTLVTFNIK